MKALIVVLYYGVVIKAGYVPEGVLQCQMNLAPQLPAIRQSYRPHGFDPNGISALCVEPGQLILSQWGQT